MADDSIEIIPPFDFHPCNSPRGMLYYDLKVLTENQQIQLNSFKTNIVRENEKYLAQHQEIRALVALITRHVLLHRPRSDLHEFVGHFFSRPKPDIQEEILHYIEAREPHICEGDSAVIIREESSKRSSEQVSSSIEEEEEEEEEEEAEEEEDLTAVPRQVLDEILTKAYQRLGIDVSDTGDWEEKAPETVETERSSQSIVRSIILETLNRAVDEKTVDEEENPLLKYLSEIEENENEWDINISDQMAESAQNEAIAFSKKLDLTSKQDVVASNQHAEDFEELKQVEESKPDVERSTKDVEESQVVEELKQDVQKAAQDVKKSQEGLKESKQDVEVPKQTEAETVEYVSTELSDKTHQDQTIIVSETPDTKQTETLIEQ